MHALFIQLLICCFVGTSVPNDERTRLRVRLYSSLARPDLADAVDTIRSLSKIVDAHERRALEGLARSFERSLTKLRLEAIAFARAADDVAAFRTTIRSANAANVSGIWLRVESALALDRDGVTTEDCARANVLLTRLVQHPGYRTDTSLGELEALFRLTNEARSTLGGSKAAAPRDTAELRRVVRTLRTRLAARRAPFPPLFVDARALEGKLGKIASKLESSRRRTRTLAARKKRLRAQIPRMTDPERRDAHSNRARIRYDTARIERQSQQEDERRAALERELSRWSALRASSRARGRDPRLP